MPAYEKDRATAERRLADLKKKEAETLTPEYERKVRDHLEKYPEPSQVGKSAWQAWNGS